MQAYIILGALLGFPLVIGLISRVSVSHLFLALLSGELLERYFKDDAEVLLSTFGTTKPLIPYTGLIILTLPMLLTALFMHHTLSKGKLILHLVPLLISGIVFAAFSVPLLPENLASQLGSTHYGRMLQDSTEMIIGVMILLQLLSMWLFGRSKEGKSKK